MRLDADLRGRLIDALMRVYNHREARGVVLGAGLDIDAVDFSDTNRVVWPSVVEQAEREGAAGVVGLVRWAFEHNRHSAPLESIAREIGVIPRRESGVSNGDAPMRLSAMMIRSHDGAEALGELIAELRLALGSADATSWPSKGWKSRRSQTSWTPRVARRMRLDVA